MTNQEDAALTAIDSLARSHPDLAPHIRWLGALFLTVGELRDNRSGKTNDFAFNNGKRDFATLTADPKKRDRATKGRLQIQVYHKGRPRFEAFERKSKSDEWEPGWYKMQLASSDDTAKVLKDLSLWLAEFSVAVREAS